MPPSLIELVTKSSLVRNSLFLMATTVVTAGSGYLYWLIAAHRFPAAATGAGSALISTLGLVSYLSSLGVSSVSIQVLPKLVYRRRAWNEFLSACLVLPTLVTAMGAVVTALILPAMNPNYLVLRDPLVTTLFIAGAIGTSLGGALDGAFVSTRRSSQQFARNAVFAVGKVPLLCLPFLSAQGSGLVALLASWDGALLASLIVSTRVLIPTIRPGFRFRPWQGTPAFLRAWRLLIGYQLSGIGASLPPYAFPTLALALLGATQTSYLYYTWSIASMVFMISPSIARALFAEGANGDQLLKTLKTATVAVAALLVPMVICCLVASPWILSLFGSDYARHGSTLLRICAVAAFPDAVTNIYIAVLSVQGRLRMMSVLNLGMAAISVAGAAVLLPHFGIDAIGWAWLAAQSLGSLIVLIDVLRLASINRRPHAVPALDYTSFRSNA